MADKKNTTATPGEGDSQESSAGDAPSTRSANVPPQAQPPNPPVDLTVDENASEEDQFRQEQSAKAALQGQPGGVPEQRPAAFQTPGDAHESRTYKELKESGHPLANDEPMPQEAYDRAADPDRMKQAQKESRRPTLREGERVRITKDEPGLRGRNGVIIQVHYSDEELQRREAGRADAAYAEPESFIVRTRDGRTDTLELKPDEVEAATVGNDGWGRGQI
jgi:hypothetical protein